MISTCTRIVLDTNVFLVSIPSRSQYHAIFRAFLDEKFTLCVTTDILVEYAEILGQRANQLIATDALEAIDSAINVAWIQGIIPGG